MTLSAQNKRWLGEYLIAEAAREESTTFTRPTKVVKVKRRSENSPSDAALEARFAGLEMPEMPVDPEWSQVISANSGKMIQPKVCSTLNYNNKSLNSNKTLT